MEKDDEPILEGFGRSDDEDEEKMEDQPEDGGIEDLPPINETFRRTPLWEAKEIPLIDARGSGPANLPRGFKNLSAFGLFLLLFPLSLVELVVEYTNMRWLVDGGDEKSFLLVNELYVWMALLIMMVNKWSRSQDSYWTDDDGGFDARPYMSRERFYWIKRNLCFSDVGARPKDGEDGEDKSYLMRCMLDTLNLTFRKYWKMGEYASMDEMMVHFKGRNPMHNHVPRKPTQMVSRCMLSVMQLAFIVLDSCWTTRPHGRFLALLALCSKELWWQV